MEFIANPHLKGRTNPQNVEIMKNILSTLASLLLCTALFAQEMTVSGTVMNNQKNKLAGATVTIKGTKTSATTNKEGRYSIVTKKGAVLVFSLSGFQSRYITVTQAQHDVILTPIQKQTEVKEIKKFTPPAPQDKICVVSSEDCVTEELVKMDELRMPLAGAKNVDASADGEVMIIRGASMNRSRVPTAPGWTSAYDNMQTEQYNVYRENRFLEPLQEPLSTFSVNVDAASYGNLRRYVNRGQLPPADAVRIEELVNYFSYNYAKPAGNDPVRITTEVGLCPWNPQNRMVRIGIKAREVGDGKLPASNLVFLIDVSGSMSGPTRLDLVKSSLKLLVNNLREKDRVAIVAYAGSAGEVLPATPGSDKQAILDALGRLDAGGSTAGGAGIQLAYKVARANFIPGGNNRVILCTDGDFNVGVSSKEGLESLIEKERQSGVYLTVLGYGMGNYKDNRLETLSAKGNGNYAYIDNLQEANKTLVQEFGGTMYAVAKDVKLQVEFNPAHVKAYRLIGYESRMLKKEDFNDDRKDAGEMGAGHTVTALYEVVPAGSNWNPAGSVDPLKYQEEPMRGYSVAQRNSPEMLTVKLRYKRPDSDQSTKMEVPLVDKGGNNVSSDFRFAAAVAMYGQIVRGSQFSGDGTLDKVIALARQGLENDPQGYRREFVRLAESTKGLMPAQAYFEE